MDRRGTHPPFHGSTDHFVDILEHLSGTRPHSIWDWPQTVYVNKALVGVITHKLMLANEGDSFFSEWQTHAQVAFNRDTISGGQPSQLLGTAYV